MSGLSEVEDWVGNNWTFQCGEDVNDVYEQIEEDWNPDLRFSLTKVLGDDLPDFIIWLQEQIDDECEDITETITFPPERIERDEEIKETKIDIEIELLNARKDLLELKIEELEERRGGFFEGVKRFIRNIFRG